MVYEYSNWLVARGNSVTVMHPAYLGKGRGESPVIYYRKACTRYLSRLIMQHWRPMWFPIHPEVKLLWVPLLREKNIPDADVIIATYWRTAEILKFIPAVKGRKFYYIQGLETWGGDEDRVMATWQLPFTRVVIAKWLGQLLADKGLPHHVVQNGTNNNIFFRDNIAKHRQPYLIGMMWHSLPLKGSSDGLAILIKMREKDSRVRAVVFGTMPRPLNIPSWVEFIERPTSSELRVIYNRCVIFLAPSHGEGWGLTASEAMMCGSAVLATRTEGHLEFIEDGKSGLMYRAQDIEDGVSKLSELLNNIDLLNKLANEGVMQMEKFSLIRKCYEFEAIVCK